MVEAEEKREANHISLQMNGYPRDLLQRSISGSHFRRKFEEVAEEEEEEIELSLGLSLNGRFGVDPKRAKKLTRSSSISDFMLTNDHNAAAFVAPPVAYTPLIRTCSLPTENTEEWRKRKELQSLRRMEAKRKRLGKQKNGRTVRDQASVEANCEENAQLQSQGSISVNGKSEFSPSVGMATWVSGATRRAGTGSARGSESKGERGIGVEGLPPPSSQGSIGSQASGSSGITEFESQPTQGINICTEARSPAAVLSLPKQNDRKPVVTPGTTTGKSIQVTGSGNEAKEIMKNMMMINMPCVTTREAGPNGKRVEGFLYRYQKGEEVRIVCVCHGSFLSPAEFVKHGGRGDVAHPLRHIVVNPSPLL